MGQPADNFRKNWQGQWQGYHSNWWDDEEDEKKAKTGPESKTTDRKENETKVITIGGDPTKTIRGFRGEYISPKVLGSILKKGCGWCGDDMREGQVFAFLSEDWCVCNKCLRDSHPVVRDGGVPDHGETFLDDDPFDDDPNVIELIPGPKQEDSPEYKQLITDAAKKAVG